MAAYLGIGAINGKTGPNQTPIGAASHNLRKIPAEMRGRAGDRINPKRSHLNRILSGPDTPAAVASLIDRLIAEAGARIKRKDQIKLFEAVVGLKEDVGDIEGFFEAAMYWMVNWFDCPLVSAVTHHDEAEPHMHMLFVPLRDGRLQGREVMGGPQELRQMAKEFQAQVGQRFGLATKRHFTTKERETGASVVLGQLQQALPPGWLSADQSFQLKRAITGANFEGVIAAFGVDADSLDDTQKRVPSTAIAVQNGGKKPDRYHCVAVRSSALPETPKRGPRVTGDADAKSGHYDIDDTPACGDKVA